MIKTLSFLRRFSRFFGLFSLALTFTTTFAIAQTKSKPLPPIEERSTSLATANDAVSEIYTSAEIPIPQELKGKLHSVPDILTVEIEAISAAISDKSVPNSEKQITYLRYTMGDERLDNALIAARKAGIPVLVISDSNPVLKSPFKKGQKFTGDFSKATLDNLDGDSGQKSFQRLTEGGFELGTDFVYQPLYNTDELERIPIMHEKAALLTIGKRVFGLLGTANASTRPRINRIMKIVDAGIIRPILNMQRH